MLYFYFYKMIPVNDVDPNGRINMVREGVLAHKAACHSQNVGTIEFLQKKIGLYQNIHKTLKRFGKKYFINLFNNFVFDIFYK